MNEGHSILRRQALIAPLILATIPVIMQAAGPQLTALSFTPASINTAAAPAAVTVNFSATDSSSTIFYFEISFTDPSGIFVQRGSAQLPPSASVTGAATVSFPQFSSPGTWQVQNAFLADSAGNTTILSSAALSASGFPTTLQVTSSSDTTPPSLIAFSIAPPSIDTSSAAANVQINFTATDNLSGVTRFEVSFLSPSGATTQRASVNLAATTSATGSATLTFPKGSEAGTWGVYGVLVADAAGNVLALDNPGMVAAGFPTTLNVTSSSDTTPPALTALSFSPSSINTTSSPAGVAVNFSATDDLSGVAAFQITFASPSATSTVQTTVTMSPSTSVTGSGIVTFPQASPAGLWTATSAVVVDAAGNTTILQTADLTAKGFPTTVSVTSVPDTTPPVLTALSFTPTSVDTFFQSVTVTVNFRATDNLSGVTTFQAQFLSPSGVFTRTAAATFAASTSVSSSASVTFPVNSESGIWTLAQVFLADASGNTTTLATSDLAALGIPTQLTVSNVPLPVTSTPTATPNPAPVGTAVALTATASSNGSTIASAQYDVDGGSFLPMTGAFGGATATISATVPAFNAAGIHTLCVRANDAFGNIGLSTCTTLAVFDTTAGFTTGGGTINVPSGADLANPTASGQLTFGFNFKYLPHDQTPSGNLDVQFPAGNFEFTSSTAVYLVVTGEPRAQVQGTGTITGGPVCKFQLDVWNGSFPPGKNDAFGLKIYSCSNGTDWFNLPTSPLRTGSIQIHK